MLRVSGRTQSWLQEGLGSGQVREVYKREESLRIAVDT